MRDTRRATLLTKQVPKSVSDNELEVMSAKQWFEYLKMSDSIIDDLLLRQHKTTVTCGTCGFTSYTFQSGFNIELSIPTEDREFTVSELLENYLQEEKLPEGTWFCPHCKTQRDGTKKIDLFKMPPVLVILLKRFRMDEKTLRFEKIDNLVKVNFDGEELKDMVSSKYYKNKCTKYTPFALIVKNINI